MNTLRRLSIRHRLVLFNILMALLVVAVGVIAFTTTHRARMDFVEVTTKYLPKAKLSATLRADSLAVLDIVNRQLTGDTVEHNNSAFTRTELSNALASLERTWQSYAALAEQTDSTPDSTFAALTANVEQVQRDANEIAGILGDPAEPVVAELQRYQASLQSTLADLQTNLDRIDTQDSLFLQGENAVSQRRVDEAVLQALLMTLAAFIVAVGAGYLLSASIMVPLSQLNRVTHNMSAGFLDHDLPEAGPDEVGQLTTNFGILVARLRNLMGSLEQRVDERTRQLADTVVALDKARVDAEGANRAKSVFLANMSHELRTPLTIIIGYSELARELASGSEEDTEELLAGSRRINEAAHHLLSLVNDILDISKIEAGRVDLRLQGFALHPLLNEVATAVKPLMNRNGNEFVVLKEEAPAHMYSDPVKLRQILLNLLSNAAKFTHDGTVTLSVTTPTIEEKPTLCFEVKDTGHGIDAEELNKLFQPFTQLGQSPTKPIEGTGLGLAISQGLAQLLDGNITVKSVVGEGSTFTLLIHVPETAQDEPPALINAIEPMSRQDRPIIKDQAPNLRFHVMVVEDHEPTRVLIKNFLQREGYAVIEARNAAEALKKVETETVDAITLDIAMPPGQDGWSVLRAIKSNAELMHIPILLVTISEDEELGLALGATDYLIKPVTQNVLATALEDALLRTNAPNHSGYILVVDDDAAIQHLVRRILERAGWRVRVADNGAAALQELESELPRLIISDLLMPNMDGFDFVAALQQKEEWRVLPVMVLTALDPLSDEEIRRLNGYVRQHMQKTSITRDELLWQVRRWVHHQQVGLPPEA